MSRGAISLPFQTVPIGFLIVPAELNFVTTFLDMINVGSKSVCYFQVADLSIVPKIS
jgi:hypothetical protein